jgi:cyclopropane fatty-acyl-phospholipid synthase-like methyltransferase
VRYSVKNTSERQQGLYYLLKQPVIYKLVELGLGAHHFRGIVSNEYVSCRRGDKLLDIGCGTADILSYLPEVEYFGFDANPAYIQAAQQKFSHRGQFHCGLVSSKSLPEQQSFDRVICMGVLHHLSDADAHTVFEMAHLALKSGGRFVVIEPCYVDKQSRIARYIISRDRGENVRTIEAYNALATNYFSNIKVTVRHDMLWIPYTHIILECTKDESSV